LADKTNSLYGEICEIVREETLYLRHYIGQVLDVNDEENRGMVKVSVIELGWDNASIAPWCSPRQLNALTVPEVGEWVEVYFISGDMNRPVYLGNVCEMRNSNQRYNIPDFYKGDANRKIIYQSTKSKKGIYIDNTEKKTVIDFEKLEAIGKEIQLLEGSEPFVLGQKLNQYLTQIVSTINTALASKLDGGGSPGTLQPPQNILSQVIKGK
jgi:hypothetical protein